MTSGTSKLLAEGVLIVVSILVAFAIDAWWADRQDRAEEQRILESLRAEFLHNAGRIPIFIGNHERSARAGQALARALHEAGPGGSVRISPVQLGHAMTHSSTDPQRGALDAILQSGELRYISNPVIRERLAGWPQLVVDATENEELLRTQWDPLLYTAVVRRADLTPLNLMDEECWGNEAPERCAASEITVPFDTGIVGFLGPAVGYSAEAARELGVLVEEAEAIIALIDDELAAQ